VEIWKSLSALLNIKSTWEVLRGPTSTWVTEACWGKITWHIDSLLGKDLKTNNKTIAVAMQQHGKHTSTTIELLLEIVFSTRSMQRGHKEDNWGDPVSWGLSPAREAEKRWRSSVVECWPAGKSVTTEAEESPFLRYVTRKWLVKAGWKKS
jgi:hypothetical protein